MFERSDDFVNEEQSRTVRPLTAAGLLLILVSTTALVTYGILTVPGVLAAKGGPPDEFLAAATAQAAQFTATPEGATPTPTSDGPTATPDEDGSDGPTATPAAQASGGDAGSTGARPPSVRPTVNPYGDWPLPDWVDDRYWLSIPQIALEAPIIALAPVDKTVEGVTVLRLPVPNSFSASWDLTSAQPGFAGNTILTGHSNFYGGVFGNLDSVTAGAEIAVWSEYGVFSYYVSSINYLEENGQPMDVRLQNAQWLNDSVDDRLTLITCWPTSTSSHRLIVVANR